MRHQNANRISILTALTIISCGQSFAQGQDTAAPTPGTPAKDLSLGGSTAPANDANPAAVPDTAPITAEDLKNVRVCLPSLGNGPDALVHLENYELRNQDYPFVKLRAKAFGTLDGKPAAVAEIVWNTGGSGNWSTCVLFRRVNGRVRGEWYYTPGTNLPKGGTVVTRINIKNDKVYLYGEAPMENRKIDTPLILKASAFMHYSP